MDSAVIFIPKLEQCLPVVGKVISPFGNRRRGHYHSGTDIKLHHGDTVRAAFTGRVCKACYYGGYGKVVILEHPKNLETFYSHLCDCLVNVGDTIQAGQAVGLGGRTGRATTDHLHFEVRKNHAARNAEKYFDFAHGILRYPLLTDSIVIKAEPRLLARKDVQERETNRGYVIIRKGDTLYSIARQNGLTVRQLQDINGLNGNLLKLGMKLRLK